LQVDAQFKLFRIVVVVDEALDKVLVERLLLLHQQKDPHLLAELLSDQELVMKELLLQKAQHHQVVLLSDQELVMKELLLLAAVVAAVDQLLLLLVAVVDLHQLQHPLLLLLLRSNLILLD
jgi:hypothetical protein